MRGERSEDNSMKDVEKRQVGWQQCKITSQEKLRGDCIERKAEQYQSKTVKQDNSVRGQRETEEETIEQDSTIEQDNKP